jgi:hypothetical protein
MNTIPKLLLAAAAVLAMTGAPVIHADTNALAGITVAPWQHR